MPDHQRNRIHCVSRISAKWQEDRSVPTESRRLLPGRAAEGSWPKAYCVGEDLLVAIGVCVADIAQVNSGSGIWSDGLLNASRDYRGRTEAIKKILGEAIGSLDIAVARPIIESLCRSIYFKMFDEDYFPPRNSMVNFQEAVKFFEECWKRSINENTKSPRKYHERAIWEACEMMRARIMITTANGLLGIGPKGTRVGDKICVILGCNNPLVLRRQKYNRYQIVGECSVDGIMAGEALLGRLPGCWKLIGKWHPELKRYFNTFLNHDSGETQIEDPRLGSLPIGWRIKSHSQQEVLNWYVNDDTGEDSGCEHPGLRIDALKRRGVKFEDFRLV